MKIFLDDIRVPKQCYLYMHSRIGKLCSIYLEEWTIVRNYQQFVEEVTRCHESNIEVTDVSFDHDLADEHYHPSMEDEIRYEEHIKTCLEKTGADCALWFKEFYKSSNKKMPKLYVHSMNPVGTKKIINIFK